MGRRRRPPAGEPREITIVGDFPIPWKNAREEIAAIKKGDAWFPSTDDFTAVERNSRKKGKTLPPLVGSSQAFIHLILNQPVGSIRRINILTHGNASSIALSGQIVDRNVSFDEGLDMGVLQGLLMHGIDYRGRTVRWEEVERRFTPDAEIIVYACKAALSERFLQDLAEYFDVTVKGFTAELHYHITYSEQKGVVHRNEITVDGKKDFADLTPPIVKKPEVKNPFE